MRPNKPRTTGAGDLFRARLDQIINLKHELVQLAARIDWDWIDREVAPLYSDNSRPGIETRFVIGLLLLKHIYGLSDEGVCERWVYDPYFQHFTGNQLRKGTGKFGKLDTFFNLGHRLPCCLSIFFRTKGSQFVEVLFEQRFITEKNLYPLFDGRARPGGKGFRSGIHRLIQIGSRRQGHFG